MDPRNLVGHEARQKAGGGHGARGSVADIPDVGDPGFEGVVVGLVERHVPGLLALRVGGLEKRLHEGVAVGERAGAVVAEPDDDGAGEGREIDDAARLVLRLRVPEQIGENEAALGVGVDDLDRVALHRGDDVAGTRGAARGHVLDEAHKPNSVDLGLAGGERVHRAGHDGRAAHVHGHLLHAARGLEGNAAGVEDHPLADERQRRRAALSAIPFHHRDDGGALAALPDRQQQVHAKLPEPVLAQDGDLDPEA